MTIKLKRKTMADKKIDPEKELQDIERLIDKKRNRIQELQAEISSLEDQALFIKDILKN